MSPNSTPNCLDYFQFDADKTTKQFTYHNVASSGSRSKGSLKIKRHSKSADFTASCASICKELFDNKESCLQVELSSLNHDAGREQHGGEMEGMDEMIIETMDNQI